MKIKIGCCGFPVAKTKYFENFSVVEIQNTFYKIPREATIRRWRNDAPKEFEFAVKAFQGITHDVSSPTWRKSSIKDYYKLKGKVGLLRPTKEVFEFWNKMEKICSILSSKIIILQFPKSFKDNENNIKSSYTFFSKIDTNLLIGVELRGWSEKSIKKLCEDFGLIDITDPFLRKPVTISNVCYFRLHGKYESGRIVYSYSYSDEELKKLYNYIKSINAKEVYVMFNNTNMYEDALRMRKLVTSEK